MAHHSLFALLLLLPDSLASLVCPASIYLACLASWVRWPCHRLMITSSNKVASKRDSNCRKQVDCCCCCCRVGGKASGVKQRSREPSKPTPDKRECQRKVSSCSQDFATMALTQKCFSYERLIDIVASDGFAENRTFSLHLLVIWHPHAESNPSVDGLFNIN